MGYYPRLRDLREDKDLSIQKLSDMLHMQQQHIIIMKPEREKFHLN